MTTPQQSRVHPSVEWGVRHAAAVDRATHVDRRSSYEDADHYRHALLWCGNTDATVVRRVPGGDWHELIPADSRAVAMNARDAKEET